MKANLDKSPYTGGGRRRPSQKDLDWQKMLLEHGYFGRSIPREYGGAGLPLDVMELAIIAEEFARVNAYPGIMNQGISMLIPTLLEVGTPAQSKEWIPGTLRGDIIWCQGYSEPGSGSDLAAAKTHARVEDGHFVINGQKIWTSSAHYSDMMFLLCRTEPDAQACRTILSVVVDEDAGYRGAAAGDDDRPRDLQRDVFH